MGRWHEVPEGIRGVVFDTANQIVQINPQKGRHLLCHFCPCEKRKQGETSRRRERKETGSQPQACRRCLSCLILPQTLVKFFLRKNLTKRSYGEVARSAGGDKRGGFRYGKSNRSNQSAKRASLVMPFLPL